MTRTPTFMMAVPWEQERLRNTKRLSLATGATIVWDTKHDAMDTWVRMLAAAGRYPAVFLEDDIDLAPNWRVLLEATIMAHSDDVIQFFSMRKADLTIGSRYESGGGFSMNQCYYLPAGAAAELVEYTPGWLATHPESPNAYDWVMRGWMKSKKMRYWVRVPSLVQHKPFRSVIDGRRSSARKSLTFGDEES